MIQLSSGGSSGTERADSCSGAGPIGLVTLLACHAAGCTPIVITDLIQSRLDFAKKLLPSVKTVKLNKEDDYTVSAQKIREACGTMPRVAMECTGFEVSINAAIYVSASRRYGRSADLA